MNYAEAMSEARAGTARPVYLLYGSEAFLQDELYRSLRAAVVRPETADFNFHLIDAGPDQIQRTVLMAQTHPFFAERRMVVLRDCPVFSASRKATDDAEAEDEKPAAAGDEALVDYLRNPVRSTCLVILGGESVDSRRKATKAAIATGGAVECIRLSEQDAVMWAQARSQSNGKRLGDQAAYLLVEKLGRDLRLIDSELGKLVLYVGDSAREITAADVQTAVGGMAETEFFHFTEAVALRQRTRALGLMQRALRQVDHPLQLLAALTGRFRQLLVVKSLVSRGVSVREGSALAKMKPFPYEKTVGFVRNDPRERIAAALSKLLEADIAMKSGFDARLVLETVVVELME